MKEYYSKAELKAYGYDHLPIFDYQTEIPKGHLLPIAKLQVDGEIRNNDLVGFHLKSKRQCFPLFKMNSNIEIIESGSLPEKYRQIQENEKINPEAIWYMNGLNLPIVQKETPMKEKTESEHHFRYKADRAHSLKGLFTKGILEHFNLSPDKYPIVSFYVTKSIQEDLYKVDGPYNEITVIYDYDYNSDEQVPGFYFLENEITIYGLTPVGKQELPDYIYHYIGFWDYSIRESAFEVYYDRSKEEKYRVRLLTDSSFHPRDWEEKRRYK